MSSATDGYYLLLIDPLGCGEVSRCRHDQGERRLAVAPTAPDLLIEAVNALRDAGYLVLSDESAFSRDPLLYGAPAVRTLIARPPEALLDVLDRPDG